VYGTNTALTLSLKGVAKDWATEVARVKSLRVGADVTWVDAAHPQYIIYTSG